jgi:hypothetical protein
VADSVLSHQYRVRCCRLYLPHGALCSSSLQGVTGVKHCSLLGTQEARSLCTQIPAVHSGWLQACAQAGAQVRPPPPAPVASRQGSRRAT